jgi:tRNA nucleotidyltransferase/poly(A) polymerase
VTIQEDVNRRDFTINALFYDIAQNKVIDFVGGVADLENRIIMTPGNPLDRFNEDGLRVMRAFRFRGRIDGRLHPEVTVAIAKKNPKLESILDTGEHVAISQERVWEEFTKALAQVHSPWDYVMELIQHNVMQEVFPGFVKTGSVVMDSRKPEFVVAALMLGRFSEAVSAAGRRVLSKYLVQKCQLSSKQAQGVVLLMRALACDAGDVHEMYKVIPRTHLKFEDVASFVSELGDKRFAAALVKYKPSVDSTSLGLDGAALGLEIKRLETELFNNILNQIPS